MCITCTNPWIVHMHIYVYAWYTHVRWCSLSHVESIEKSKQVYPDNRHIPICFYCIFENLFLKMCYSIYLLWVIWVFVEFLEVMKLQGLFFILATSFLIAPVSKGFWYTVAVFKVPWVLCFVFFRSQLLTGHYLGKYFIVCWSLSIC